MLMMVLGARAQKKWDELDVDGSDELDGDEVLALAEWVWGSFRPGQTITSEERVKEATKIMHRCDKDGNGKIDRGEFGEYYEKVCEESFRFNKDRAAKAKHDLQAVTAVNVSAASPETLPKVQGSASQSGASAQRVPVLGRHDHTMLVVW